MRKPVPNLTHFGKKNLRYCYSKYNAVCFKPHKQFFSYLAAVTITVDRASNSGLCSTLGVWAGRDLYRATPTATWDFGCYSLIRKTGTHVTRWDSNPPRMDHVIFASDALATAPRGWLLVQNIQCLNHGMDLFFRSLMKYHPPPLSKKWRKAASLCVVHDAKFLSWGGGVMAPLRKKAHQIDLFLIR